MQFDVFFEDELLTALLASHLRLLQGSFLGAECRFDEREPSYGKHAANVDNVAS